MKVFQFLGRNRLLSVSCFTIASLGPGVISPAFRSSAFVRTSASDSTAFHLGTAAGLFGWSSAVADFNDDGRPDFAVADRLTGSPGRYRYRVLFAVAGKTVQTVSFESFSSALNVAVRDVDDDHDLDVVIVDAPTAAVNAVWLNDGQGQFIKGEPPASNSVSMASAALNPQSEERPPSSAVVRNLALPAYRWEDAEPEPVLAICSIPAGAVPASGPVSAPSRAPPAGAPFI